MNVLFISGHPAHVHNFRLIREELLKHGHHVYWMTTDKDICLQLLKIYGIPYVLLKKPGKSFVDRVKVLYKNTRTVLSYMRKNKIDMAVSRTNPYSSMACFLLHRPHIIMSDTEHASAKKIMLFFSNMSAAILVPECFNYIMRKDQIYFAGNIELCYTHNKRFRPQDPCDLLGIQPGTKYAIVRFVNWDAYHDVNLAGGFSLQHKRDLVDRLSQYLRVLISSEIPLPTELEPFRINIPLERMHDVLAYAELIIGESATMASESVMLGTPAIYIDEVGRGYTDEEAEKGLLFMFRPNQQEEAIQKAVEVVSPSFDRVLFAEKQMDFLSKKIDPTAFFTWFIEDFPESKKIMEENPEYQYRFR